MAEVGLVIDCNTTDNGHVSGNDIVKKAEQHPAHMGLAFRCIPSPTRMRQNHDKFLHSVPARKLRCRLLAVMHSRPL